MIPIYRCESQAIADYLHSNNIDYDIVGCDRDGTIFFGYYKSEELELYLDNFRKE